MKKYLLYFTNKLQYFIPPLLVIAFFIEHNYLEYNENLKIKELEVFGLYCFVTTFLFYFISFFLFKDRFKSTLLTTYVIFFLLFFGALQDSLSNIKSLAFLSYMPILIIISLLLFIAVIILVKINKLPKSVPRYITILFSLFVLIDLGQILIKNSEQTHDQEKEIISENKAKQVPIYLVILDEYAGKVSLKENFKYDNSPFEQQLKKRGFNVTDSSSSNYCWTIYSMASLLNMEYLDDIGKFNANNHYGYKKALTLIRKSKVINFLKKRGYKIINHSPFDILEAQATEKNDFLITDIRLLTSQTFPYRLLKSVAVFFNKYNFRTDYTEKTNDKILAYVNNVMAQTIQNAKENPTYPTFTYIHFVMPHGPYIMDSAGNRIDFKKSNLTTQQNSNDNYIQYLVYCNKKILPWIDEIMLAHKKNAIIVLMSDHGFRFQNQPSENKLYSFNNLNSIYIPNMNYSSWHKGFSNVNQFRVIFNSIFNDRMGLLKDSVIFP